MKGDEMLIVDEILGSDGPLGEYRVVYGAEIVDAGQNVVASVSTAEQVDEFLDSHRGGPYYLTATRLGIKVQPNPDDWATGEIGFGRAN